MRPLVPILGGALALAGAVLAAALLRPAGAEGVRLRPDDAAVTARGAEVYAAECAACHGAALEGQPDWRAAGPDGLRPAPPHDATGHTWHHDDATLFALTKHGLAGLMPNAPPSGMPAYEGVLSDGEIVAVLSYIKSTWPADVRARHDAINERARP
ncbi:MAG: c-type cytochrome [Hasllibacter sp.]